MDSYKTNSHYRIYLDKTFNLAKTLVIKSEAIADIMNNRVKLLTGNPESVDPYDPSTWRYYLNICGEYHSQDLFELRGKLKIISVDTLEEIEFTKENLISHKATRKAYQYGTRKYEELVVKYPKYEMLILGILYPANMDEAINAPDGKILSYPPNLVEVNEYSFIDDLQRWIDGYRLRWTNRAYSLTDTYYDITNLSVMYLHLIPAILNIRLQKCKTNEAHSYHVRQFLASHGFLDNYLDVLTLKQSLRFYRNICYIERNIGKMSTFDWLTRNVMTERNLPLSEYNMYHNTETMDKDIYPTPFFKKKGINNLEYITSDDDKTVAELLDTEIPLARGNDSFRKDNDVEIYDKFKTSISNKVRTKVLESKAIDFSNAQHFRHIDVLHDMWLDWADRKLYRAMITFENIKSGERTHLNAKDAFYLYWYCFQRSIGYEPKYLPTLIVGRVPRTPMPSREDVFSIVPNEPRIVNEPRAVEQKYYDEITDIMPAEEVMISTEDFYNKATELHRVMNLQHGLATLEEELNRRAYKEAMNARLYQMRYIHPESSEITYESWLEDKSIHFKNMTKHNWNDAAISLMKTSTGLDLDTTISLRALQRAMVRLMKQLSSYSVQYIREINESDLIIFENPDLRTTNPFTYSATNLTFRNGLEVLDVKTSSGANIDISEKDGEDHLRLELNTYSSSNIKLKDGLNAWIYGHNGSNLLLRSGIDAYVEVEDFDNRRGHIPVPGISSFAKQPLMKQLQLTDIEGRDYYYDDGCNKVHTQEPDDWYLNRDLQGFDYPIKIEAQIPDLDGFYDSDKPERDIKDLYGFDYLVKSLTDIPSLTGFDYPEKPHDDLMDLSGFDYEYKPSRDIKDLQGFDYHTEDSVVIKDLVGFEYGLKPSRNIQDLAGFDYPNEPYISDLKGFDYPDNNKPLVGISNLKGFSYPEKPIRDIADLVGFKD